jgi:4'-phosphopantetheinyl transferase
LRELLSRYLNCAPSLIRFSKNAFGKPSLTAGELRFNLSHSNGMVLYVIGRGKEVGCDIEHCDPQLASEEIAERFFSPSEVASLRSVAPAERNRSFFNCWTRKEAYVKARGCGLSLPLDSFDVSLVPGEAAALLRGCDGWSVESFEPARDYHAAVVAEGTDWRLDFRPYLKAVSGSSPLIREGSQRVAPR